MKKRFLNLFLILCVGITLCGCKNTIENTQENPNIANTSETTSIVENNSIDTEEIKIFDDIEYMGTETKVKLNNYKEIYLSLEPQEVTDANVEREGLTILKNTYGFEKNYDKEIVAGDKICIDFVGTIDGKEFDGGSSNNMGYVFVVGEGGFLDGFENGIVGSKPGTILTNEVVFPTDYGVEHLNGKTASFEITINFVCGNEIETYFTDEFVKENTKYKSLDEFKVAVKTILEKNIKLDFEQNKENYRNSALLDYIIKNTDIISLNKEDAIYYYKNSIFEYEAYAQSFGYTMDLFCETFLGTSSAEFYETMKQTAIDYVTFKGICIYVAEQEKIVVDNNDFNEYLNTIATQQNSTVEDIEMQIVENNLKQQIMDEILQQKIIDYLSGNIINN